MVAWLLDAQRPDGSWEDRWHASPLYATSACALALGEYGRGPAVAAALERATTWLLDTQRPDGSWGRFAGTAEETAYAVTALLRAAPAGAGPLASAHRRLTAAERGHPHLVAALERPDDGEPALWHDKELYRPHAIVRAALLAAIDLGQRRTGLTGRLASGHTELEHGY